MGAHLQSRRACKEHVMDEVIEARADGVGRRHAVLRERLRGDASKVCTDIRLELLDVVNVEATPEQRSLVVVHAGDEWHVVLTTGVVHDDGVVRDDPAVDVGRPDRS